MSTLFDFSKKISDQEMLTKQKLESFILPYQIVRLTPIFYDQQIIKDFVIEFPHKTLNESLKQKDISDNHFQFNLSLWGGGSSGIKPSLTSNFATGGYSSGIILRFPIDFDPTNKFLVVRLGTGGSSFDLSELKVINNGEASWVYLLQSEYINAFKNAKYRSVQNSEGKTKEIEKLISYGAGIDEEGNKIQSNSTNLFYSFDGANPSNTNIPTDNLDDYDHRNFYSPYLSVYDGYPSFMGIGGNHKTNLDAQENSGAGGSGYLPNISKEIDKQLKVKAPRVGKGGNGGMIIEYDNYKKINVYVVGYRYIDLFQNKIVFLVEQNTFTIVFENRVYAISEIFSLMQSSLPQNTTVSLTQDHRLKIKMTKPWSLDLTKSSLELLSEFGFTSKDNPTWSNFLAQYEMTFTNTFYDICLLERLKTR
jgi:hypothetical protein